MAFQKLTTLLAAATGAAAALATVFITDAFRAEPPEPASERQPTIAPDSPEASEQRKTIVLRPQSGDIETLQQQVDELREKQSQTEQETLPPDPEQEQKALEARFAELDRNHRSDPYDPRWSREATDHLTQGLADIAEAMGFSLNSAECKTTSCRATLEWSDYESAMGNGLSLPERSFPGLNCAQTIWLKPPSNPNVPYAAELYLDCTSQRAGTVEVASTDG